MVHANPLSSPRRRGDVPRLTPLARGLLAACLLSPALTSLPVQAAGPAAPALPTGPQVVHGQATVATQGSQMTVRNTPGAILNWQSFSIAAGHGVYFDQASASSKVLNRVLGKDPSQIFGSLASNGQVWLLNPNGVLFGRGARVDVASLVASTLRLGDSDFLAGRYRFGGGDVQGQAAGVRNEGSLQTSFGGQVVLLGDRVENAGDIQAPGGQVALAAARSLTLVDTGLPHLAVQMDLPAGEVLNLGRLAAAGGRVDVYGAIVNQQGLVSAQTLSLGAQGQIVLRASETLTLGEASRTEAGGTASGQRGGDITLSGRDIAIAGAAVVDASGEAGGGRIRLGGGLQGRDGGVPNAATVRVDAAARLAADAGSLGDGGQIIVWSDHSTQFLGQLSARGGALGGDGGFAEVSSRRVLGFAGMADLGAGLGATGTLLLDPSFLVIQASAPNLTGSGSLDLSTPNLLFGDHGSITSIITAAAVNSQLNSANVVLQASVDISVNAAISGSRSLTLQAGRDIIVNSAISAGGGIVLSANDPGGTAGGTGAVQVAAALNAGGGALSLSNNGGSGEHQIGASLSAASLSISGNAQLTQASTWTLSGNSTLAGQIGGSGVLTKAGAGTLTLTGSGSFAPMAVAAGTLNFNNASAVTLPSLTLTGGTFGGSGEVVVSGAFDVIGSYANLTGSGSLTTLGTSTVNLANVSGGYLGMNRPWTNNGTLNIAGDDFIYLGLPGGGATTLTNALGATLNLNSTHSQPLTHYTGTSTVHNAGTLNQNTSGTHAIGASSFSNVGTVNVNAGTLTLSGGGSDTGIYNLAAGTTLALSGGTRSMAASVDVSGPGTVRVDGGTLNISDAVGTADTPVVISGGTLNFNGSTTVTLPSLTLLSGTLGGSGNVIVAGAFDVTGSYANLTGSGSLTTLGTSTVNLANVGGGYLGMNRPWINQGTLNIAGDDFVYLGLPSGGTSTLTNAANATLNISSTSGNALIHYTGTTVIDNAGTLNLNASGSHTLSATSLHNSGLVNVNAGTLVLSANGSDSGSYAVASGATLDFSGGTRTLDTASSVSGAGTLRVSGATVHGNGTLGLVNTGAAIVVGSGTLNLGGAVSGTLAPTSVSGGTLNFNNSSAVTLPSLTLTGGTIGGSGDVIVSGAFNVTGSYANLTGSGSLTTLGTSTVNLASVSGGYLGMNRPWINQGTLNIAGDDFVYLGLPSGGTSTLTNADGATLNISSTSGNALIHYTGTTVIDNAGTLNLNASGSHTLSATSLHNSGLVNVNAGTLVLSANGSDSGSYAVASGATLDFSGGTRTLDTASSVSGAGTLRVSGATVHGNGTLGLVNTGAAIVVGSGTLNLGGAVSGTLAPTSVSGGTLNFNNSSAVTLPSLTLTGGTIGGSGDFVVSGAFDVIGSYAYLTGSGSLSTQGTSTVNLASVNGGYLGLNRHWINNGTLNIAGDDFVYLGLPSGGTTTLTNAANATLNLSSTNASALVHYTGTTTVHNAGTLNQNVSGSHTLSASSFHNSGVVNVPVGTLLLSANGSDSGSYAVAAGATLDFSGGTRTLETASSVSGAGTLKVSGASVQGLGALSLANTGAAIVVSNGTLSLGGAVSGTLAPTSVSGGTLNFDNSSAVTLPSLTLTGGTLGGSGDFSISGAFDITGSYAYITGSGSLTTQGTSTLNLANVSNGYLGLNRNWINNGTLNIAGDDFVYLGLPNGGTTTLTNAAGATLNLASSYSHPLVQYTGSTSIHNAGTLNQSASGSHTLNPSSFHNSGTVNVLAGSLVLSANGSDSGSYALAAGSTLNLSGGTRTLTAGASLSGPGSLTVSGATLNVDTAIDFSDTAVRVSAGTLNFNNGSAVTLPNLALSGGTVGGSGDVIVSGAFDVTGSYASLTGSGSLTTQGTSTVNLANVTGGYLGLSRNWNNSGTLNIGGDDFIYFGLPSGGNSTLTNLAGGTLTLSSTQATPLVLYTGTQNIVNAGTLNQTASGSHGIGLPFSNSGTVNVSAGTLVLSGNGSDTGGYALAAGSTLHIAGGTRTLASGASLSGGNLVVSNGTLQVNGQVDFGSTPVSISGGALNFNQAAAVTVPSLSLSSGTLGGSGDVVVSGAFDATGSYAFLTGSGSLTTEGTSTVNLAAVNGGYLGMNRRWINRGHLTVGGDDLLYFGLPNGDSGGTSTLSNQAGATLTLASSYVSPLLTYTGTSLLANAGTLELAASGTHNLSLGGVQNTGSLQVAQGAWTVNGTLSQSGLIQTDAGTSLRVLGNLSNQAGGTLAGTGTLIVGGTLTNLGTISPAGAGSAGTLSISGHLALSGGTLAIDLGGSGASDLLAVSGNVTLGGNLSANLLAGYTPGVAEHVAIVSAGGTSSGAFSGTALPAGFTAGYQLAANEAARLIYSGSSGAKVFTNAANDLNWATPANWSGALPGSTDSAILSAGYDVLYASGNHTIAALIIAGGNSLTVSGGALTVTGSTTLGGSLTVSGSGAATLNGDLSGAGQVAVQGGSLLLHGASSMARLSLGAGALGGGGSLQVSEAFSRSAAASVAADFSSIGITQVSGDLSPGALSAGTLTLNAQDPNGRLVIDGRVASAGALTIQAAGPLQLAGSNAALVAGGDLSVSAHSLDLAAPISGQRLVVVGTHGVQLRDAAQLSASATSGDAIVLDAAGTGPFINQVGAGVLSTAGGRWLVYSADPMADTVGGLAASFRQYNAPYGASTPLGSGNGLLYSLAPTLSIGLQGTVAKVYDGHAGASLLPANYSLSGALAIDSISLNPPASGLYVDGGSASRSAGSGKTVQVSGLTLTASDSAAGYPVYGLQFNTTASAPVGSITPAPLAVGGLVALAKVYDGGTAASLAGAATVAPLAGDQVQLAGSASASFADKNVGTAKPVMLSGLVLSGADAGNYTLQAPAGLQADITPAPLAVGGLVALAKVYDGGTAASLAGAATVAPLAGDQVQLAGSASASFADKNVGMAKAVTVAGLTLSGADAGNYTLQAPAGLQADITPRLLSVIGLAVADKVYDGSTTASASASLGGAVAGDALGLALSAQFADRHAGNAKTVGVQLQLSGADAGNYLLPAASTTAQASIGQATLTYLATPASAPAGTLPEQILLTGTVSGFVGSDNQANSTSGSLAWTTPATAASPSGSYAISGGGLAAANYRFVQAAGNATALTLGPPIVAEVIAVAASTQSSTQTAITQALAVVAPPVEMSTPTSGRVLDVLQSLSVVEAGGNTPTYDSVNLSQMQRDEIQSLLAARANFKRKVFDGGIGKLQIDPALADVRGCRSVAELSGGACLLTAALKQEIAAERARAAAAAAAAEAAARKPAGRRVVRAVLPTIQRKLALLIGVNAYQDKRIPQLKGAVPDARGVRDVLENHLGYETTVVEDPGREAMVRALNKLALEAGPEDSVVIYYAGHGVVVPVTGKDGKDSKEELGYWVPGDGDVDKPETWLANSDIAKLVALVNARQVLLVSDSCYSGTLAGSERVQLDTRTDAADLLKRKAAVVMSSGGNEPVADVGRNGHSVFAWYLMETLKKLSDWSVGVSVFDSVRAAVAKSLPQTPQYGASRSAGHQGNTDYLFEQREIERSPTP
ncbi:MAG: filamentous hemagglutinin N-terminal domain-containing protein [Burkholderiaceae bacterium]|nr:filamentous hemagglutinin N-terminal domain-containing protein [Burkholderiaceae bacterium]